MTRQDKIKELVELVTREDGLLGIGKYGHEVLEDLLTRAWRGGQKDILERIEDALRLLNYYRCGEHIKLKKKLTRIISIIKE